MKGSSGSELIKKIRHQIEETTSDYDREKLQERLAKLAPWPGERVSMQDRLRPETRFILRTSPPFRVTHKLLDPMKTKFCLLLALGAFVLIPFNHGFAQTDAVTKEDKEFFKNAGEINMTETALGRLAQEKAFSPEVLSLIHI